MAVGTAPANVFDADLPTLEYGDEETPAEVRPRQQQAARKHAQFGGVEAVAVVLGANQLG